MRDDPEISWFEWVLLAVIIGACSAFIVYGIGVGIAHWAGWAS